MSELAGPGGVVSALCISEDHCSLAEVARSVLTSRDARSVSRAALNGAGEEPGFWKDVVALGWLGLHVEERFGGQGYGLPELAVVVGELGRCVAPGPFLSTVVASAAIQLAGTDDQRARWLPELASGARTAALGLGGSLTVTGATVNGDAGAVLGGDGAAVLVLTAGDDLVVVEAGAAGIDTEVRDRLDLTRPATAVRCTGVPVADVIPGGARPARRVGWALAAAEASGGMAACADMTVAYAQARQQFGRVIGGFMAVKHHCVNLLAGAELSAAATWDAVRPADDEREAELAAACAAAYALDAYTRLTALAVQVHGGIGYTWEHDTNLYLRRAAGLAAFFGAPDTPRAVAAELHRAGVRRPATLDLPPEAESHRAAARAFVDAYRAAPEPERRRLWSRSNYLAPHWPPPYGRGADAVEQLVIEEELSGLERPDLGLGEWVIPTLLQHGTAEQIERWIWPSLDGQYRWCQLFSEPGAGSDAAAVATRAVRIDGGWSVTGQKVWTSDARNCHYGLATIRTDPSAPKHHGITAMVINLQAPGVEIRPLTELTGEQLFNEVFFDDVFVPDHEVVGAVNDGWRVARATLGHERISIGGRSSSMAADTLCELLDRHRPDDPGLARDVGALLAEAYAIRILNLRQAARAVSDGSGSAEGSLAKLVGAEHAQRIVDLGLRIAGPAALLDTEPTLVHDYFFTRCLTIAGGTSEVLRNQIGESILNLPREPR